MANYKYYTEEELIEKVENGEFNMLDYVTCKSKEQTAEFKEYCKKHNLDISEDSALRFLDHKDAEFTKYMNE